MGVLPLTARQGLRPWVTIVRVGRRKGKGFIVHLIAPLNIDRVTVEIVIVLGLSVTSKSVLIKYSEFEYSEEIVYSILWLSAKEI